MNLYSNRNGDSGVSAYEIGTDFIRVQFNTGKIYSYSYNGGAGASNVEQMKILARRGAGLNSYINTNVKFKYDR